jgi:hypothetical protein
MATFGCWCCSPFSARKLASIIVPLALQNIQNTGIIFLNLLSHARNLITGPLFSSPCNFVDRIIRAQRRKLIMLEFSHLRKIRQLPSAGELLHGEFQSEGGTNAQYELPEMQGRDGAGSHSRWRIHRGAVAAGVRGQSRIFQLLEDAEDVRLPNYGRPLYAMRVPRTVHPAVKFAPLFPSRKATRPALPLPPKQKPPNLRYGGFRAAPTRGRAVKWIVPQTRPTASALQGRHRSPDTPQAR